MNWFILSLIAILFWSGSDLFSKIGAKPDDIYSHWKMVIVVGLVMGAHAIFMLATAPPSPPWTSSHTSPPPPATSPP